jgi:parallel beta-helix repeat protein
MRKGMGNSLINFSVIDKRKLSALFYWLVIGLSTVCPTFAEVPEAPLLDTIPPTTETNPISVSGSTSSNAEVQIYVSDELSNTVTADGTGAFSGNAALNDGVNDIHAIANDEGEQSEPSETSSTYYTNTITDRTFSDLDILQDTVWTAGEVPSPYVVSEGLTVGSGNTLTIGRGAEVQITNGAFTVNDGASVVIKRNAVLHLYYEFLISAGGNLTIEPGVKVVFHSNYGLRIRGEVLVNGSVGSEVLFTSGQLTPQPGDWQGLIIDASYLSVGNVVIDHAVIEYANNGLYFYTSGERGTVTHTELRYNTTGVWLSGYYSPSSEVHNPVPAINDSSLHDNGRNVEASPTYYNASNYVIDMRRNWWGSTDSGKIQSSIVDQSDGSTRRAIVNYQQFVDEQGDPYFPAGSEIIGFASDTDNALEPGRDYYLLGKTQVPSDASWTWVSGANLTDAYGDSEIAVRAGASLTIAAGAQYTELSSARFSVYGAMEIGAGSALHAGAITVENEGVLTVRAGSELHLYGPVEVDATGQLVIEAGVKVVFHSNDSLTIRGDAVVQGVAGNEVVFTSGQLTPQPGDWQGLRIDANYNISVGNVVIDHAVIEYANNGLYFYTSGERGTVTHTELRYNTTGVWLSGYYSPSSEVHNPVPAINDSSLHDNGRNVEASPTYYNASNYVIDMRRNWWGSTDSGKIQSSIVDQSDGSTRRAIVNYQQFVDEQGDPYFPAGSEIIGFASDTDNALEPGRDYYLLGKTQVPSDASWTWVSGANLTDAYGDSEIAVRAGASLTIAAGAQYTELSSARFSVYGTMDIGVGAVLHAGAMTIQSEGEFIVRSGSQLHLYERLKVEAKGRLQIEAGAKVVFHTNNVLTILGTLEVNGSAGNEVIFTSGQLTPQSGDWQGVSIETRSATDGHVVINHAVVEYANTGLNFYQSGDRGTVTHTELRHNTIGVRLNNWHYTSNEIYNPVPTINDSSLHDNGTNVQAGASYKNAQNYIIDMRRNWWGSTDINTIFDSIEDSRDGINRPLIDIREFLDQHNGSPAYPGEFTLFGSIDTDRTLKKDREYFLLGNITIETDVTMTIEDGATLYMDANTIVDVQGRIDIIGLADNPVILTSLATQPEKGDWGGLTFRSGSVLNMEHAVVKYANSGISFYGGTGTITNTLIEKNTRGVTVAIGSSPTITNSFIVNNDYGLYVSGPGAGSSSPNPYPVVTSSSLHSNNEYDYYSENFSLPAESILNARNNYWGTDNPSEIAGNIFDYSDEPTSSFVDFGDFSDTHGGASVSGVTLLGQVAPVTDLPIGTYTLIGDLIVPDNSALSIDGGTVLKFAGPFSIDVNGSINIVGSETEKVIFTSANESSPEKGDWLGIEINNPTSCRVDHVVVEYASSGLKLFNTTCSVTHSLFQNNTHGIHLSSGANAYIGEDNTLTKNDVGIYITNFASTPTMPTIQGNSIIANDEYGIYIRAYSEYQYTLPLINTNHIHSNLLSNIYAFGFSNSATTQIDATGNWWGTTDIYTIAAGIYDYKNTSASPFIDYSGFLNSSGTPEPVGNVLFGQLTEDTTLLADTHYTVLSDLIVPNDMTLTIPEGARLEWVKHAELKIDGNLVVEGSESAMAVFSSAKSSDVSAEDWNGINVAAAATVSMTNTIVEYAVDGIKFTRNEVVQTISKSIFRNNSRGIVTIGETNLEILSSEIIANTIGIDFSSALVGCSSETGGLEPVNSAVPLISSSTIAQNSNYGVLLTGVQALPYWSVSCGYDPDGGTFYKRYTEPNPTLSHNSIYDNGEYSIKMRDYHHRWNSNGLIDATYTWWGTDDPLAIAASLLDGSDQTSYPRSTPIIDYRFYLNDEGGTPASDKMYIGVLLADTTLESGQQYLFLGDTIVDEAASLIIESGAVLNFIGRSSELRVEGNLTVNGTALDPVVFTSFETYPEKNDWEGISIRKGASAEINFALIEYARNAVEFENTTGSIGNSTLINNGTGIVVIAGTGPTIGPNNTLRLNNAGIQLLRSQFDEPTEFSIEGNTIIENSEYGIYIDGVDTAVIKNNTIADNVNASQVVRNIYTEYNNKLTEGALINARNNWWGTDNPTLITDYIYDGSDAHSVYQGYVDFQGFLDHRGGTPSTIPMLLGYIRSDITLLANTQYWVAGDVTINIGVDLTMEPGVQYELLGDFSLSVIGSLDINGTSDNYVNFVMADEPDQAGDWRGINVNRLGAVSIDYASIEYANVGLYIAGDATVENSLIQNNTTAIEMRGSQDVLISNGNVIRNNQYGIYAHDFRETYNDPLPVVTGNKIYNNQEYNYRASAFYYTYSFELNATGNWWGSADLASIAVGIDDYSYSSSSPFIDYSGYRESEDGPPSTKPILFGRLEDSLTISVGETYDVIGGLVVPSGQTLTIEQGVQLRFVDNAALTIYGTLHVNGTENQEVLLTTVSSDLQPGRWQGIVAKTDADVAVDYAHIMYSTAGLFAEAVSSVAISDSFIYEVESYGIYLKDSDVGQIQNNLIVNDSGPRGYGIYFDDSSVLIDGNSIQGMQFGIYLTGQSSPEITRNTISLNEYGIYLYGGGNDQSNPHPTIIGNEIYGNFSSQLVIYNYGQNASNVINATDNWWGTDEPQLGEEIDISSNSAQDIIDYSQAKETAERVGLISALSVSADYFSPNGNSASNTLTIQGGLNLTASWGVKIYNQNREMIREFSGSGTAINITWDGRSTSGAVVADGNYEIKLVITTAEHNNKLLYLTNVIADSTIPIALISNPDGSTQRSTIVITGSASDHNLQQYSLSYRRLGSEVTSLASSTASVASGILYPWYLHDQNGNQPVLAPGDYQLTLNVTDKAGNSATHIVDFALEALGISNVSADKGDINAVAGESVTVSFDLALPATVELSVINELTHEEVARVPGEFNSSGTHSISWDGRRTDNAKIVPDEGYIYRLIANNSYESVTYDPQDSSGSYLNVGNIDGTLSTNRNDFLTRTLSIAKNLRATYTEGTNDNYVLRKKAFAAGDHIIQWNGRDKYNRILYGDQTGFFYDLDVMPVNSIVVSGGTPAIKGIHAAPNIEVKSDPYLVVHSYNQISTIPFTIDQNSMVTVKLLPPNITDPGHSTALTLLDEQPLSSSIGQGELAVHEVQWKGYDDAVDPNRMLVSKQGVYSFWIKATSQITGVSSTYFGVIRLYQ